MPVPSWYSPIPVQRDGVLPAPSPPGSSPPGSGPPLDPGRVPRGRRGGRRRLVVVLSTLVALGAGALGVVLLVGGAGPAPGPAAPPSAGPPSVAPVPAPLAGELPVPEPSTGTATLSDPAITTVKAPLAAAGQWCSLLSAADVRATTGFEQQGLPDGASLCTHYLADGAGYLLVSDIPALQGAAHTVRGNSAIVYQSNPASCEVTVALNRGGGVLDLDLRGVLRPRVPLCQAAANLAARAFDRLPAG